MFVVLRTAKQTTREILEFYDIFIQACFDAVDTVLHKANIYVIKRVGNGNIDDVSAAKSPS